MNKAEYAEYLESEHWKKTAQSMKEMYGKCQLCGATKWLNVHHVLEISEKHKNLLRG